MADHEPESPRLQEKGWVRLFILRFLNNSNWYFQKGKPGSPSSLCTLMILGVNPSHEAWSVRPLPDAKRK